MEVGTVCVMRSDMIVSCVPVFWFIVYFVVSFSLSVFSIRVCLLTVTLYRCGCVLLVKELTVWYGCFVCIQVGLGNNP